MVGVGARQRYAFGVTTPGEGVAQNTPTPALGEVVEVEIGPVAHGGHCVARLDGRVIFVRHALPGERARVRITEARRKGFWRGDAVEILQASPLRVDPPCSIAGPGRCGGCDFQHVSAAGQRELKAFVVAEQLQRLAGLEWAGEVEAVGELTGWRTRMGYRADERGRLALRAHRSHDLVELPEQGCLIAHPNARPELAGWPADGGVDVVATQAGPRVLRRGDEVTENAAGREWRVASDGFWQIHPAAADTLVQAVLAGVEPQAGERAFDLYCGVGLFAGALNEAGAQVWGVEENRVAIAHAKDNVPSARFTASRVEKFVAQLPRRTDLIVLDPPRSGAGKTVMEQIVRRQPRKIAYVACDPAALARDLGFALELGYTVESVRAFDLFPMTQHVECVAILAFGRLAP